MIFAKCTEKNKNITWYEFIYKEIEEEAQMSQIVFYLIYWFTIKKNTDGHWMIRNFRVDFISFLKS